jgi:integrase
MAQIRKKALQGGGFSYEARIHLARMPAKSRSFKKLADAKRWASEVEGGARDPGQEAPSVKFSELTRQWLVAQSRRPQRAQDRPEGWEHDLDWLSENSKATRGEIYRVRQVMHDWGEFAVSAIQRANIERWLARLADEDVRPQPGKKAAHYLYSGGTPRKYAASTRRKWFYTLKKLLDWHAAINGYKLPANLYQQLEIPASWEQERERLLEDGEEERLAAAAASGYAYREEWPLLIGFALETAMRAQEMLKAQWRHIDLEKRNLHIPREHSKTDREREVPLSKRAVVILEEMRQRVGPTAGPDARVFWPWPDSNVLARGFRRLCHRAGIDGLKIHDLRHTATTRFFRNPKLDSVVIKKITGHESMDTLSRYFKLRPGTVHELLD